MSTNVIHLFKIQQRSFGIAIIVKKPKAVTLVQTNLSMKWKDLAFKQTSQQAF